MTSPALQRPLRELQPTRMERVRGHIGAAEGLLSAIRDELPYSDPEIDPMSARERCVELLQVLENAYSDYIVPIEEALGDVSEDMKERVG